MPRAKLLECPQCGSTDNVVRRHRKRGDLVHRERFCRPCRRRFYTQSFDNRRESYCGNPFTPRTAVSLIYGRAYR